jgi:ABC-type transporter Mla subunit MlaD
MPEKQTRRRQTKRKSQRLESAAQDASTAVTQAATVLEDELSSGLAGVRKIEQRFTKERRVDQKEFDEVLERFRTNAHELIDVAAGRMADLRSDEVEDLSRRLTTDAHDLFDTVLNLVGMAPDVVNRLAGRAEEQFPEPAKPRAAPQRRTTKARTSK